MRYLLQLLRERKDVCKMCEIQFNYEEEYRKLTGKYPSEESEEE